MKKLRKIEKTEQFDEKVEPVIICETARLIPVRGPNGEVIWTTEKIEEETEYYTVE